MGFGRTFVLITRCLMILGISKCIRNYTLLRCRQNNLERIRSYFDLTLFFWNRNKPHSSWPPLPIPLNCITFDWYSFFIICAFWKDNCYKTSFFPVNGRYEFKAVSFPNWSNMEFIKYFQNKSLTILCKV